MITDYTVQVQVRHASLILFHKIQISDCRSLHYLRRVKIKNWLISIVVSGALPWVRNRGRGEGVVALPLVIASVL